MATIYFGYVFLVAAIIFAGVLGIVLSQREEREDDGTERRLHGDCDGPDYWEGL